MSELSGNRLFSVMLQGSGSTRLLELHRALESIGAPEACAFELCMDCCAGKEVRVFEGPLHACVEAAKALEGKEVSICVFPSSEIV